MPLEPITMRLRMSPDAFNPTRVSGLAAWWDTSGGVVEATGGISQITDLSGNGKHFTQATSTKRAAKVTDATSGRFVAQFDGVDDEYTCGALVAQPLTVFCVVKTLLTATYVYDGTNGTDRCAMADDLGSGANRMAAFAGSVISAPFTFAGSVPHVWTSCFNGASSTVKLDNAAFSSGASGATGLVAGMTLGNRYALSFFMSGTFAEMAVYSGVISGANETAIFNYLKAKWGTP